MPSAVAKSTVTGLALAAESVTVNVNGVTPELLSPACTSSTDRESGSGPQQLGKLGDESVLVAIVGRPRRARRHGELRRSCPPTQISTAGRVEGEGQCPIPLRVRSQASAEEQRRVGGMEHGQKRVVEVAPVAVRVNPRVQARPQRVGKRELWTAWGGQVVLRVTGHVHIAGGINRNRPAHIFAAAAEET